LYGAKNNSKLEINDPSFILDKIAFEKDNIGLTIPKLYLDKNNSCAITFIDYYGNESHPTFLTTPAEIKTKAQLK
jgi:hypothetical protein